MTFISNKATVIFSDYQATLADGAEIDSDWLDMQGVDKVQMSANGTVLGMDLVIESRADPSQTPLISTTPYNEGVFFLFNIICRQRYMRFRWQNNTGGGSTNASLEIKQTFGSSDKLSVFPVSVQPSDFSQAALVQSIMRGQDPFGVYSAVGVNQAGAMLQSDFGTEVARGLYEGYSINTKFGRNSDTDVGQTEDLWNGGGLYTGFDPTGNENIEVLSSSADDAGTLVTSGTATGGSSTTIVDTGANFIADGVAVGDCVINDTKAEHGIVTNVTSASTLTVFRMTTGTGQDSVGNQNGDTYRIASPSSTGAAVMKVTQILDENYDEQQDKYVILDGTTPVTVPVNAFRCTRAFAVIAGTAGQNIGTITLRQDTTTANVFAQVPTTGQTTIAAFTVPRGKTCLAKRVRAAITRSNGSAGSATIILYCREPGGAFNGVRVFDLQTGATTEFSSEGAIVFPEGTDVKFQITNVSDSNTRSEAAIEYYLIDNN